MLAKISMLLLFVVLIVISKTQGQGKSGHCPLSNSISNCVPRCWSDYECSSTKKCCPNKCGSKSCTEAGAIYTGSGYKENDAVYCGGVKCHPSEKCERDRKTNRERCVRK